MRGRVSMENELYQELEAAREALFMSRTLKEARFWQEKIKYIESLLKKNNIKNKKQ
ncbi:MAG: hypothetical protein RMJ18_03045 [Candidatus Aenigmarchaeota archaeon]|nr:hypothetical protein [Candidatus Aenigmarchaeota archaeon]MCX8190940.1 hypothetical protein [Candidatus Aenigmarchaeota archaeon]MDW8160366.1 hypothetical protein [Candidatus Aenigmarchaeota archaeon]